MIGPFHRICIAAFLLDSALMIGFVAIPFYVLQQLGGGTAMVGTLMAVYAVSYAGICLGSAQFVSRSRNGLHWALGGMVVFATCFALIPWVPTFWGCAGLVALGSAALALVWPALHAWVGAEPIPEDRARRMMVFNICWSAGFAFSPLIAGPLYDIDYRLPFVALFLCGIATFLLILSLPHERDFFGAATTEVLEARKEHDRESEVYLYSAWCATMVANLLVGVTRSVFPERILKLVTSDQLQVLFESESIVGLHNYPATLYACLAFLLSLVTASCFLIMGRTKGWRHRIGLILGLQGLTAFAFLVLGHTTSLFVMALCFIIAGANLGVAFFSSTYYSLSNPVYKHRRVAINESASGTGRFSGSFVFGILAERFGLAFPFHLTPFVVIAAMAAEWQLIQKRRKSLANNGGISGIISME